MIASDGLPHQEPMLLENSSNMLLMLIASDGLPHQEPMPLENSSNMLLMLLALVQRSGAVLARQWLAPYLPLLTTWTEVLIGTALSPTPNC